MMTHLLTRIDLMMNSLSKGQKRIALFIEEHYDKAAFMTASKLGETVGVSESTVVRFATELGYDGYPHLQRALQEMIRNKLTSVQRMEVAGDRMGGRAARGYGHDPCNARRDLPRRFSGCGGRAHGR